MYLVQRTNITSMLTIFGIFQMVVTQLEARLNSRSHQCEDTASWCRKLGRKIPMSRCYDPRHKSRCCETCELLKLPIPACEYGDRDPALCQTIDKTRPVSDCYAFNNTCCQTCHLLDSGIPDCPYGDRVTWCSGIGDLYEVSSCYDHEIFCCDTCRQFRTGIPGDTTRCPYGDRLIWCAGIGSAFPISHCRLAADSCCESCHRFKDLYTPDPDTTPNERNASMTDLAVTTDEPGNARKTTTTANSIRDGSHLANVTRSSWKHSSSTKPAPTAINTVLTDTSLWQPQTRRDSSHNSNKGAAAVSESRINSTHTQVISQHPETGNNSGSSVETEKSDSGRDFSSKSPNVSLGRSNDSGSDAAKAANQTVSTPSGLKIYTAESSDIASDRPSHVNDAPHLQTSFTEISLGEQEEKQPTYNESISQGVSSGCRMLHSGPRRDYLLPVVISLCWYLAGHCHQIDHKLRR